MSEDKYERCKCVVIQMLKDRGYTNINTRNERVENDTNNEEFPFDYHFIITFNKNEKSNGCVILPKCTKININHVALYTKFTLESNFNSFILVCPGQITHKARNELIYNIKDVYDNEFFYIDELQINIVQHRLVPKHSRLSSEEKEKIVRQYIGHDVSGHDVSGHNNSKNEYDDDGLRKFPLMLESDPISRYYNFKKGDVIKVDRGSSICYRYVI